MRIVRILLFAFALFLGFYFFTTHHRDVPWVGNSGRLELTQASGPESLDPEEQVNVAVYKKALPSVVNIKSRAVSFNFFYGLVPEEGQGSGFLLDKDGHILTNYHVIANARQVEVTMYNRKTYKAEVIGTDPPQDLAIIQIRGGNFTPATLGDSRGLQVGTKVYAIGNPFGLSGTMTNGIISSIRPVEEPGGNRIDDAIQTDAAINPGNSGGPLLNSRGEVIGINTMILSSVGQSAGIGFAIPINTAKALLNDLVQYGQVRRPSLGIRGLPIGPELAEQLGLPSDFGVLIISVTPGGSADRAGLKGGSQRAYLGNTPILLGGDLLVAIDDQQIEDTRDLAQVMNSHRAGDKVFVTVYRGQRKMKVQVTLVEAGESRS